MIKSELLSPALSKTSRFTVRFAIIDKAHIILDVRTIVAKKMKTNIEKVSSETSFLELGANSLDILEIVMNLEEKFDLKFKEDGIDEIKSVQEVATLIVILLSLV